MNLYDRSIANSFLASTLLALLAAAAVASAQECPDFRVEIQAMPDRGFAPLTVQFQPIVTAADGSAASYQFEWDFGDGHVSTEPLPVHTFEYAGYMIVGLRVWNRCGDEERATRPIVVDAPCPDFALGIEVSPDGGFTPVEVNFRAVIETHGGSSEAYQLRWDFGDGTNASELEPRHTFTDAGTYTVLLEARNRCGVFQRTLRQVVIQPGCPTYLAHLSASPAEGTVPLTVAFIADARGSGGPVSEYDCAWQFGDGSSDSGVRTEHTFMTAGRFTVSLTMTDRCGIKQTAELPIEVHRECPDFDVAVDSKDPGGAPPRRVSFKARVTMTRSNIASFTYNWDFGDGGGSTEPTPEHVYKSFGEFVVRVGVTDECGKIRRAEQRIVVACAPFELSIRKSPEHGIAPVEVSLSAVAAPRDVQLKAVEWDFGDGSSGRGPTVTHVYRRPGSYRIALDATDECGTTERSSETFEASEIPIALKMRADKDELAAGEEVSFLIIIKNPSASPLTDLELVDHLPSELLLVKEKSDLSFSGNGQSLKWRGSVPPHSDEEVQILAKVKDRVSRGTRIENEAVLSAPGLANEMPTGKVKIEVK